MSIRYVYLKNGKDLVAQQQFSCEAKKEAIIEKWKKLYGKKFQQLTVQEELPEMKEKYKSPKANKKFYGSINFNRKRNITNIRKDWGYRD